MFGYVVDLSGVKQRMQQAFDAQWRVWGGLAFALIAMAAIQYDEIIGPEVNRLSGGWSTVATDFSKRLTSFTL